MRNVKALGIILLLCLPLFPATYYFASNGDDSRTVTQAQDQATPWQTIDKLNTLTLAAGDNILFRRGDVFRGGIVLKQSGNSTQPITIGAYGTGNAPVVDGSIAVSSGWNLYQGSIYWAKSFGAVEQVFRNGVPLQIARYPNQGYLTVDSVVSKASFISKGLIGQVNWTGASVHVKTERWSLDWRVIKSHDKTTGLVVLDRDANYNPQKGWGFFINNSYSALDKPGEWYFDTLMNMLYVWMPDGGVPASVEASVVPYGLDAQGRNYITVENLRFTKHSRSGIRSSGSNVIIRNCIIEYADGIGIDASIADSRIENCVVKFSNQTGVELNGANNTLAGDTIACIAMMEHLNGRGLGGGCCSGRGLDFNGAGNVIRNCMLDSIGYIGIGFGGQNSVIENNIVNHVCMTTDDGGAIYTWNDDFAHPGSAGTIIRKNIVMNGVGAPEGGGGGSGWVHGIYMDDRTHDVRIDSNTSINNVLGIFLHNNRNNTAQGNVCYGNRGVQIQVQRDAIVSDNVYGNTVTGNVFFSTSDTQSTIKEELYTGNDSVLASIYNNLTGVENPFGVECRRDNVLLWKQNYIDAQALRVGANKIRNGNFDSTSLGWGSWPSQYFNLAVDSIKSADRRCLKIRYFGDPAQGTPIFQANGSYPIVAGKLYCLAFSAVENHPGFLTPICRIGHSSYASVGLSKQVALDIAWQDFEMFFDGTVSDTACRVDFQVSKSDSLIWLDKVSLYEINDAGLTRDLRSRCFFNTNTSDQVFSLGSDTWREVSGTRGIRWSITLLAFLSRVMIKDSIGVVNKIVDQMKMLSRDRMPVVRQGGVGIIKVRFNVTKMEKVVIDIMNLRGQIVFSREIKVLNSGWHDEIIRYKGQITRGIYILKVTGSQFALNQRVMILN
jgi:parallel beta-helix repeat protein